MTGATARHGVGTLERKSGRLRVVEGTRHPRRSPRFGPVTVAARQRQRPVRILLWLLCDEEGSCRQEPHDFTQEQYPYGNRRPFNSCSANNLLESEARIPSG
jgi:hypothetical protein